MESSSQVAVRVRAAGLVLAPAAAAALWVSPLPLEPDAHALAAVFGAVIVAWVTEALPIPVTALLIAPAMVATGVTDAKTAFAPYADPLLFLFVGGFFIARAMTRHGLDRRLAGALLGSAAVGAVPWRVRAAFMLAGLMLSMWISNTATTAILLPILLGTLGISMDGADAEDTPPHVPGSLLAVAYGASVGGLGTLVGSPPNLIAAGMLTEAGHEMGFLRWMMIGLPVALVLTVVVFLYSLRAAPPAPVGDSLEALRDRGPMSQGERVTALAFALAVAGWMIPGLLKAAGVPGGAELARALPGGGVALFAASVLFVFRDEGGDRVLPWPDAARIDWGIIMLFGGGISLGAQMFDTGLASAIARGFVGATGVDDVWSLTALVTVFTIFFTEVCSNTASANMLVPLVIAAADELEVSPLPPALGVALAASCAFMLPIATGPNAVAFGTGHVPSQTMMRSGLVLNVVAALVVFGLLRLLCALYGWG